MIKTDTPKKMSLSQYLIPQGSLPKVIPSYLFKRYTRIASDPDIHSGWPHIRGTRVLTSDVFKNWLQFNQIDRLAKEYKSIGAKVSDNDLNQALEFMIAWMSINLNETKKTVSK